MSENNKVALTQQGFDDLQTELNQLQEEKIPTAITRVATARAEGDLRENSEYHAAREELAMLESRRDQLQNLLQQAKIVKKTKSDKVQLGSEVEVSIQGQQKSIVFTVVGEYEADPKAKKISEKSPLGQALTGKKAGEIVSIEAPAGNIDYKIIKVF